MGFPGSGKSTVTKSLIAEGYRNHNRDIFGGTRDMYNNALEALVQSGEKKLVLDNTYPDPDTRSGPLAIAKKYGYSIEAWLMETTLEQSMYNAVSRQVKTYGKVLDNEELAATKSPNMFPVLVQYRYRKQFVMPTVEEGFDTVKTIPFVKEPLPKDYVNKAIILDYDGTIRTTKTGNKAPNTVDDIVILPGRYEVLQAYKERGYILLGVSNQAGISKGHLDKSMATSCFQETHKKLGITLDYRFCPHQSVPVNCYCRKPGVGFAVEFIHKYKLDPSRCIMVGDMTSDKTFAKRAGFKYQDQSIFFKI